MVVQQPASPRILFLITEDWYFWSHRLDLARAAASAGFDVSIATRVKDHGERICKEGLRIFSIRLFRRGRNPFAELSSIFELIRLYRREHPTIVHHVALKPILYGSIAAWCAGVPIVVNAFAGLGYAFTDQKRHGGLLGACLRRALSMALNLRDSTIIFQNRDDRDLLVQEHVVDVQKTRIIPGSGIDTEAFVIRPPSDGDPIVMLASRMLWDKGIGEFVEVARWLRQAGTAARFVLVGRCDEHNPAAIAPRQLHQWVHERIVEWWGHRDDMPAVFAQAALVVLPSYREGLPKVLLEAAACGKPLIASDVPGCREVVRQGVNGLLVPVRNSKALSDAIATLLADAPRRESMGHASRQLVEQEYSVRKVTGQVIDLYRELLATQGERVPVQGHA